MVINLTFVDCDIKAFY